MVLNISYKDHITNEETCKKIQAAIGEHDELLSMVRKWKLTCFGYVSKSFELAKRKEKEKEVDRRRGGKTLLKSGQG